MLEIKVDIIPFGQEDLRETLDSIKIINTGQHENKPEYGEYMVIHEGGSFIIPSHKRDDGFWDLVRQAICGYISCPYQPEGE